MTILLLVRHGETDWLGEKLAGRLRILVRGATNRLMEPALLELPPGGATTAESLRLATRSSLMRAEEKTFKSIAFPAIGTGVAGFPLESCARIMLREVIDHLKVRSSLEKVYFVLFDEPALKIFVDAYQELTGRPTAGAP